MGVRRSGMSASRGAVVTRSWRPAVTHSSVRLDHLGQRTDKAARVDREKEERTRRVLVLGRHSTSRQRKSMGAAGVFGGRRAKIAASPSALWPSEKANSATIQRINTKPMSGSVLPPSRGKAKTL